MTPEHPSAPVLGGSRRVRFQGLEFRLFPDSRCRCEVTLEWGGRSVKGAADGTDTRQGRLQAGALACVRACGEVANDDLVLEMRGVKSVKAFDREVVIVHVQGKGPGSPYRLIGSTAAPAGDLATGAAIAVLDAVNRVLEKYLPPPEA